MPRNAKTTKRIRRVKKTDKQIINGLVTIKKGNIISRRGTPVDYHVSLTPVFKTKDQEEMFARCARASMSSNVKLEW